MERTSAECVNEVCWVLIGQRRGRIWYARRKARVVGKATEVEFDAATVLQREEQRGDVVGFLHTHPNSPASCSRRDVKTMRAWASCFGKPLLCVIDGVDGLAGFRFDDDASPGMELPLVESFPRGVVIAVEDE